MNIKTIRLQKKKNDSITFSIDDTISAPEQKVKYVRGNSDWIKGKRCLAKKTSDGVVICYLSETDSNLFHDNKTIAKLDGSMGQWMTDIPSYRYYHTGGEYENKNQNIFHTITLYHDEDDDNITTYEDKLFRRSLVGVTKTVLNNGKIWSMTGKRPYQAATVADASVTNLFNLIDTIGNGWGAISYETSCKIAHLFYGKYFHTAPKLMNNFGLGSITKEMNVGSTANMGNIDGTNGITGNFLGIEAFINGMYEVCYGMQSVIIDNKRHIFIFDGRPSFELEIPHIVNRELIFELERNNTNYTYGNITKILLGKYGDICGINIANDTVCNTDYCSLISPEFNVDSKPFAHRRSLQDNHNWQGLVSDSRMNINLGMNNTTSRLEYRGKITVIDDITDFINLPNNF